MSAPSTDPRFLDGVSSFNKTAFFQAHESWEAVWMEVEGPEREFYKGLIQVAVSLLHFTNGNVRGAKKLYHSSRRYLSPFRPMHAGLDVDLLFDQYARCCAELLRADEKSTPRLDPELLPRIELSTSLDHLNGSIGREVGDD